MITLGTDLTAAEMAFVESVEMATLFELRASMIRATPCWHAKFVHGIRCLELATTSMALLVIPSQTLLKLNQDEYLNCLRMNLAEGSTIDSEVEPKKPANRRRR